MNAEEILIYIIDLFTYYLDELNTLKRNDFIHGEITAYTETLELLQNWDKANPNGLNFKIADKYKV